MYENLIPAKDPYFCLNPHHKSLIDSITKLHKDNHKVNVLLRGETGTGKTSFVYEFAHQKQLPLIKQSCALIREPRDWLGQKTVTDGTIHWVPSLFAEVVEQGNAVILLDEISRATPQVLNTLMPLLDHTHSCYLEEVKHNITVGDNLYFFATTNLGGRYTGTWKLDSALANRFGIIIECDYLSEEDEINVLVNKTAVSQDFANKLVTVANMIRANSTSFGGILDEVVSTRTLLETSMLYKHLGVYAFDYTLLPLYPKSNVDGQRSKVIQIVQSQFGLEYSNNF